MRKWITTSLALVITILLMGCWEVKKKTNSSVENGGTDSIETLTPSNSESAREQLSQHVSDNLLFDAPTCARYLLSSVKELAQDKIVKFDFSKDGNEEIILLGRDHPNGVRVLAERKNITQNLISAIDEGYFFDAYGELKEPNAIQVTVTDVNGDGTCEVIVSIGQVGVRVDAFIFEIRDTNSGSYHYLGRVSGKERMVLTPNYELHTIDKEGRSRNYKLRSSQLISIK